MNFLAGISPSGSEKAAIENASSEIRSNLRLVSATMVTGVQSVRTLALVELRDRVTTTECAIA